MRLTVWGRGHASKVLAKALGVKRNLFTADTIIRYRRLDSHGAIRQINSVEAIRRSSHKYKSLQIIQEAGLDIPQITKDKAIVKADIIASPANIWFGRDYYHSKGTDIEVYTYETCSIPTRDYYIKYMKPKGEYRYHVAFNKVILCTKKILAEGQTNDTLIRNHQNGKWVQVTCTETNSFSEACIKSVKALGLDFGAVDFINVRGIPYILEVNTAPGLEVENRLDAYVRAIKENVR